MFALLTSRTRDKISGIPVLLGLSKGNARVEIPAFFLSYSFLSFFLQLQIARGRLTLKNNELFRSGSVRKPYERSLYERTKVNLHRETCYIN